MIFPSRNISPLGVTRTYSTAVVTPDLISPGTQKLRLAPSKQTTPAKSNGFQLLALQDLSPINSPYAIVGLTGAIYSSGGKSVSFVNGTTNHYFSSPHRTSMTLGNVARTSIYWAWCGAINSVGAGAALYNTGRGVHCDGNGNYWGLHTGTNSGVPTGAFYWWDGAAKYANIALPTMGSKMVLIGKLASGVLSLKLNGNAPVNVSGVGALSSVGGTHMLGHNILGQVCTNETCELIFWESDIGSTNETDLLNYFADEYGVVL